MLKQRFINKIRDKSNRFVSFAEKNSNLNNKGKSRRKQLFITL